jgi:anaerobic ribonucleoside-triphosphate reductase
VKITDFLPKVNTSKGGFVEFNQDKIIKSLKEEVGLSHNDSIKITMETVREFIKYNITFLATPQIREWVCIVLQKFGYIEERKKYTRRGMSSAEIERIDPRSDKIKEQIKQLQEMGYWENNSVGKVVYEVFKEHYALKDPYFVIIWKVHRLLKAFKKFFRINNTEELKKKSERFLQLFIEKKLERRSV